MEAPTANIGVVGEAVKKVDIQVHLCTQAMETKPQTGFRVKQRIVMAQ